MWSGKNAVITPYALFFALWKLVPTFSNYKQQVYPFITRVFYSIVIDL